MIKTTLISKHILRATIRRPNALNAVNFQVMEDLEKIVNLIDSNEEIRVFILSGEGTEAFISGGDLREFHTIVSKDKAQAMSARMHTLLNKLEQLPCWNIAFVNGDAYGGGIETMLAFDFRIAAPKVKLGFTQSRFYLTPGWGGLTRLVEKVGRSKALMWLAKAEVISVDVALSEGVLDYIIEGTDAEQEVLDWAEKLTKNDRAFIKILKGGTFTSNEIRLAAMEKEIGPFSKLWVAEEHIKRVEAFFKK